MAKIFISYDPQNETIARKLTGDIETLGHNVWLRLRIKPGVSLRSETVDRMRDCALVVFVLSPEWLNSEVCASEHDLAVSLGKPVLVVLISEGVNRERLPPSQFQLVDYRRQDPDTFRQLAGTLDSFAETASLEQQAGPYPQFQDREMPQESESVRGEGFGHRIKDLLGELWNGPSAHAPRPAAAPPTRAGAAGDDKSKGFDINDEPARRPRSEIAPEIAPDMTHRDRGPGSHAEIAPEIAPEIASAIVDEVDATVYAPNQAAPGDNFLVLVYAHLPAQAAAVEEEAKALAPDVKKRFGRKLDERIARGAKLRFDLTMPGLGIDEPSQSLVWQGEYDSVQFSVTVPQDSKPRTLVGTVIVSKDTVPVGHLKFTLRIASDNAPALSPQPVQAGSLIPYKCAFISYASQDRAEVLKRVQMLGASKVDFFQDLLTLEPGDRFEKLIYEYIDRCDVFFLFWSKAASESIWVRKEIEYAEARKHGNEQTPPEFVPVIIEGPPPAKPPKELSFLHFNDRFMYFIKVEEDLR